MSGRFAQTPPVVSQLPTRQSQNSPAPQSASVLQTWQVVPAAASGQVRIVLRNSLRAHWRESRPARIAGLMMPSTQRALTPGGPQQSHWAATMSCSDASIGASPGLLPQGGPA
jgi:hypothetical protein